MKFFFAHKSTSQRQKFKVKLLTGSAQIFLYVRFSFRLSARLNIDRTITKIGTNDRYHE